MPITESKIETITRLLALAEGSIGPEAELAFVKAQEFATLLSVDLAVIRRQMADKNKRETPVSKRIKFDAELATRNTKKALVEVISYIAYVNDCKLNILHDSSGVILFGMPSDIEMVERMFPIIAVQMISGANAFLKTKAYRSEMVTYYDQWGDPTTKPCDGRTARLNYYDNFGNQIYRRLNEMKREAEKSVEKQTVVVDDTTSTSVALVLVEKREEVSAFYKQTSNARGSWKGSSSSAYSSSASSAGRRDGASARLGRETQIGGSRTALR